MPPCKHTDVRTGRYTGSPYERPDVTGTSISNTLHLARACHNLHTLRMHFHHEHIAPHNITGSALRNPHLTRIVIGLRDVSLEPHALCTILDAQGSMVTLDVSWHHVHRRNPSHAERLGAGDPTGGTHRFTSDGMSRALLSFSPIPPTIGGNLPVSMPAADRTHSATHRGDAGAGFGCHRTRGRRRHTAAVFHTELELSATPG